MSNKEENAQLKELTDEVKELKKMLIKQSIQNKKMTYAMFINLYLIATFLAYFLVIK